MLRLLSDQCRALMLYLLFVLVALSAVQPAAAAPEQCFPETGQCINPRFEQ